MNTYQQKNIYTNMAIFAVLLAVAVLLFLPGHVEASTANTVFNSTWDTIKAWIQGSFGRIVVGMMIIVGVIGGIARQSLMAFALGIGGGLGLYNTPSIVESILTAIIYNPSIMDATTVLSITNHLNL